MDPFTFFYMITTSCASTICGNCCLSSTGRFNSLVKDQVAIGVWVHFWVFNSIPLVYLSVDIIRSNLDYSYILESHHQKKNFMIGLVLSNRENK
jgi:hypothetical protein